MIFEEMNTDHKLHRKLEEMGLEHRSHDLYTCFSLMLTYYTINIPEFCHHLILLYYIWIPLFWNITLLSLFKNKN